MTGGRGRGPEKKHPNHSRLENVLKWLKGERTSENSLKANFREHPF